jgi:hypothetical protein
MTTAVSNKTPCKTSLLDARDLKARVDLVLFTGQFTRLRRLGRLRGLCPFHSERHPSFYVDPDKQVFKCFGCGAGGDVFAFVMRLKGCGFLGALRIMAEFSDGGSQDNSRTRDSRDRILASLDATERRLAAITRTNALASLSLLTACEPERGEGFSFTCTQRISANGRDYGLE